MSKGSSGDEADGEMEFDGDDRTRYSNEQVPRQNEEPRLHTNAKALCGCPHIAQADHSTM